MFELILLQMCSLWLLLIRQRYVALLPFHLPMSYMLLLCLVDAGLSFTVSLGWHFYCSPILSSTFTRPSIHFLCKSWLICRKSLILKSHPLRHCPQIRRATLQMPAPRRNEMNKGYHPSPLSPPRWLLKWSWMNEKEKWAILLFNYKNHDWHLG